MANIVNGRYALADPSSGLTMLSLEGGELNMFGSYTRIRTTHKESYPVIDDEPTELAVKNNVIGQLITGLAIAAVLAGVAIAVVVTGGAALAPLACALGGAAIGVGAVAIGTAINDSETGYNRSWGEYWGGLITGGYIGFMAGAAVYGIIAAVPAAAGVILEGDIAFTTTAGTVIMTSGGATSFGGILTGIGGGLTTSEIIISTGATAMILDTVFNSNIKSNEVFDILPKTLLLEDFMQEDEEQQSGNGVYIEQSKQKNAPSEEKEHKKRRPSNKTKKKTKDEIPNRYKGRYPYKGEAGKDAAKRIMEELGEYDPKDTGAGSLFNQLKKHFDNDFMD